MAKGTSSFVFALAVLVLLSSFASAQYGAASTQHVLDIHATLISQDPDPVEPGDFVVIKFKVENNGSETLNDVQMEIVPEYPFTLYSESAVRNIGKLQAAQSGADAVIIDYKLRVDERAISGDHEIKIKLRIGEDTWLDYTDNKFFIRIQTVDAILGIISVTSDSNPVEQGKQATLTIKLKNMADSLLKEIRVRPEITSTPFAPFESNIEKRIFQLTPGVEETLNFPLIAKPDAAAGLYVIPIQISYVDKLGKSYNISDFISLAVGAKPELKIFIRSSTIVEAKERGTVTLEIANTGVTNVKFAQLTLLPNKDYQLLSSSDYIYIGDVDSDDTESQDFDIYVNKKGAVIIPVLLEYQDANNQKYQQKIDLELKVYSSSEVSKFGLKKSSPILPLLAVVIMAIAGFIYWKKFKKKK